MSDYCFTVNITPLPTPRPRVTKKGFAYYPKNYSIYREELKKELKMILKDIKVIERLKPIKLDVVFFMPIPKSFSKKKKIELLGTWHIKKPDEDNLLKGLKDSLEGLLYHNDSQVSWGSARKVYSDSPRIEVMCEILKEKYE